MPQFAMRGSSRRAVPVAHSYKALEIRGHFNIQGPGLVGDEEGCVPEWIWDLFQANPDIESISINRADHGSVYSRPLTKEEN